MTNFLRDIGSPYWWLSVFVVGLAVNLLSAYLKPRLDRLLAKGSTSWATRNEKKKAAFLARVERCRSSEHQQVMLSHSVTRQYLATLTILVMAGILVTFVSIIDALPAPLGVAVAEKVHP